MNAASDALYTAEQIRIPPDLPDILKNYTKHIIRTQPGNILKESVEYFGRLAKQRSDGGGLKRLNNMQLEALYNKFDQPGRTVVTKSELDDACASFTISQAHVNDVLRLGGWTGDKIPWLKCWALFVTSAVGSLSATIETIANLLGDNGRIRVEPVVLVLQYLAEQDKTIDKSQADSVVKTLMVNNFDCPVETVIELARSELQPTHGSYQTSAPVAASVPPPSETPAPQPAPAPQAVPAAQTNADVEDSSRESASSLAPESESAAAVPEDETREEGAEDEGDREGADEVDEDIKEPEVEEKTLAEKDE
ncbi:Ropporin-1-like protein [Geranomyces michiganensis]|nr:Ropporin-1-like protein [Geranomyces michiganensis]